MSQTYANFGHRPRLVLHTQPQQDPPSVLPRLLTEPAPEHHGFGRPRRMDKDRDLVLYVAWARDVAGLTKPEVADLLYGADHRGLDRVKAAQRDGRKLYHARGVLPWAAYGDGKPPPGWLADSTFAEAMRRWQAEAVEQPSDEPQPGLERELLEADPRWRALTSALMMWGPAVVESLLAAISLDHPSPDVERVLREHGIEPCPAAVESLLAISPDPSPDVEHVLREHGVEPWSLDA